LEDLGGMRVVFVELIRIFACGYSFVEVSRGVAGRTCLVLRQIYMVVHLYNFKGSDVHWSIAEIDMSDL
jgi:hypothetical protein